MFLFKLWIFEIDIDFLIALILGIIIGIVILSLVFLLLTLNSLRDIKYLAPTDDDSLTEAEAKKMIYIAHEAFNDKELIKENGKINHCISICKDLAYSIAAKFYPNSKYPLYELTIDETILLIGYIQTRVDEILGRKIIKFFRRYRISSYAKLFNISSAVVGSKAFEVGKDVTVVASKVKRVINVLNPIKWVQKLTIDKVINVIISKICIAIISIVGEETYKIYSKKLFNVESSIDSGIDEMLDDLKKEIKETEAELVAVDPRIDDDIRFKKRIITKQMLEDSYETILDLEAKMKMKNEIVF